MGKRQRKSHLVNLSDQQIIRLAADAAISRKDRRDAVAEAKFRGLRNVQRRGKDSR
jgi:hypothetical protein